MALGSLKARDIALDACYGSTHSAVWADIHYLHLFDLNPLVGGRELLYGVGGYEALEVVNTNTSWNAAQNSQKTNKATLTFPESTGSWSATATYWWLTDAATAVEVPGIPTVTVEGTGGTTTWQYVITARNSVGETQASGIGVTTVGNATLSATNYNKLTWTAVTGATLYNVYRKVGTSFLRIATGVATETYDDTGGTTTAVSPPTTNGTMNLLDGGPLTSPISVTAAGFYIIFEPDTIVITQT